MQFFCYIIRNNGHMLKISPTQANIYLYVSSKVGDRSRERPEGFHFNSYYTAVLGMTLLLSLDCSTLPLIRNLYCWVISKDVSSTIFKVFGMTRTGIEPRSPGPLANTLSTRPMSRAFYTYMWIYTNSKFLTPNPLPCAIVTEER